MIRSKSKSVRVRVLFTLQPGESATFTKECKIGDTKARAKISREVGVDALRAHPDGTWEYESFSCVTAAARMLAGVIITRRA